MQFWALLLFYFKNKDLECNSLPGYKCVESDTIFHSGDILYLLNYFSIAHISYKVPSYDYAYIINLTTINMVMGHVHRNVAPPQEYGQSYSSSTLENMKKNSTQNIKKNRECLKQKK